jgi:hypothetical protein
VDLARRDRVQPRRGLVQEQHRRIIEQRSGERDPLAQALRQRPARIAHAVEKVDRPQRTLDPPTDIVELVKPGEALQVLHHREALIQTGGLGHDRNPRTDRRAVVRGQLNPGDRRPPRTWCDQRAQRAHGRGLARPVRTQEAEHLAVADLK